MSTDKWQIKMNMTVKGKDHTVYEKTILGQRCFMERHPCTLIFYTNGGVEIHDSEEELIKQLTTEASQRKTVNTK